MPARGRLIAIAAAFAALFTGGAALAGSGEPDCRSIIDQSLDKNSLGFEDAVADVTLEIHGRTGAKRERRVRIQAKKNGELNRSLVRFLEPADVAGTGFLVLENADRDDDQYIFLPALKKVKRINASQRGESFMGTDFTYADLESRDVEESDCKRLADAPVGGNDAYVVESIPKAKDEDDPYSKVVSWIHKGNFVPLKVEFYDRSGKLLKILTARKIEKIDGRWVTTSSEMANQQKGTKTVITIHTIQFGQPIDDEVFTTRTLERG